MRRVNLILTFGLLILGSMAAAEDWTVTDAPIVVRDEVRNIVPDRRQVEVMQQAFANGRRLQDLVMEEIRPSRTGGEVFDAAMARAQDEGLRADVYSHPLPLYLNRYELNGGFVFLDRYGAGPGISQDEGDPEADLLMGRNSVYALELDVLYSVPEWGGQDVRMMLETNIAVTEKDARFLGGRQTGCFLVY
jgi:hypothetical protein